ncbi:helix-turn-helix domain-containing protein [Paenibacillus sp. PAMC21692]|uniref:helix-turn-helix domain-containing protein n=1 Tax=Paenibacillus sp. PAMC21692 TaxID=2762320 RepID=UPI00164D862B|nr:helix-turn-helix transcriptional regulator [Paenibacillus sp. PAMC21692]QNK57446.1 helix-turn-helix transcriptional regulator [Paenibacillus sp. PAMC21692]
MGMKEAVGEQIRKARKVKGMTQERLAELSGLSFSYISDVERGTRNISLESLEKIVTALNIKPAQLFADIDEAVHPNDIVHNRLDSLHTLLIDRDADEIAFVIKVAQEFLMTVERKSKSL